MSCPLPPPDPPVQFRTPSPQSNPKKHHQSSPVKPVVQHFAEHKRDEVQAFGYDEGIHQVKDFKTHEDFFNFLRVSEEAIKKHSGKVSKMVDEKASKASDFSRENFVQAANTLAKSIKDDCEYLLSLAPFFLVDLTFRLNSRFCKRAPPSVQVHGKQNPSRAHNRH